jgi:Ca-activated chloride channel family protein
MFIPGQPSPGPEVVTRDGAQAVKGDHMKDQAHTTLRLLLVSSLFLTILMLAQPALAQQSRKTFVPDSAGTSPGNDDRVAISTEVISVTVSVTDIEGRMITGLGKNAFSIYEDKVAQEISFFSAQDSPASIGVIFDLSGSMQGQKIARAREALKHFIETSHADDDYCLIGFNDRAEVLMESTGDSEALLSRLSGVQPRGDTALYDAVALGLDQVTRGRWPRRALIVISDGEDNNSRIAFRKIRQMVKESDVAIYGILIREYIPRGLGDLVMEELGAVSGGRNYLADSVEQMSAAFEKIALELRQQYSIGYIPSRFVADGKWRKIKVRVTPSPDSPKLVVRSREGYYAVADRSRRTQAHAGTGN